MIEELIPDLQCFNCKSVPGPRTKERYFCIKESHPICLECIDEMCPCGSDISQNSPNFLDKFLDQFPWMCRNYKTGCRESMEIGALAFHQENCIYRSIFCPYFDCTDKKVIFDDLKKHISSVHNPPRALEPNEDGLFQLFYDFNPK